MTTVNATELDTIRAVLATEALGEITLLDETDSLYREPSTEWVRPFSTLRGTEAELRENLANGLPVAFCEVYDRNGSRIYLDGLDWAAAKSGHYLGRLQHIPNAVAELNDGLIYVSRGMWYVDAEVETPDGPAFRCVTANVKLDEMRAEVEAASAAWLAEHPGVEFLRPEWATTTFVELGEDSAEVEFSRSNGPDHVSVSTTWTREGFGPISEPGLYIKSIEDGTIEDALTRLEAAADLLRTVQQYI